MKTIKIIDILVLIANEEYDKLPKKIKYRDTYYEYISNATDYENKDAEYLIESIAKYNIILNLLLNDEVEIIEEEYKPRKIEEMNFEYGEFIHNRTFVEQILEKKINEIKDAVNYLLEREKHNE